MIPRLKCIIDNGALPSLLSLLRHNHKKSIMKEACWTISNITAGNKHQIQSIIEAGLIGPLVNLLQNADFDIKKEATWAISNATSGGTRDQINVSRGTGKHLEGRRGRESRGTHWGHQCLCSND
ncbi:hypothetical protein SAY86_021036 [Trapa natans]|uniref:Uncharacterized protein n=1 Tax=Trapa natans TaxID=22666 RepID=A0AAN7M927_TRANT|nr:hypothetical protein SAY86_021036 [Trapa natans]